MARLLLISNSTLHGSGYLDHVETEIRDFLKDTRRIAFVPFALYDRNQYATQARERFRGMGCDLISVHDVSNPQRAVKDADAVTLRLESPGSDSPSRKSRDALYRIERGVDCRLSEFEDNQRHARRATAFI